MDSAGYLTYKMKRGLAKYWYNNYRFRTSEKLFRNTLIYAQNLFGTDAAVIAEIHGELALCYLHLNEFEKSINSATEAVCIAEAKQDINNLGTYRNILGYIKLEIGDTDNAHKDFRTAMKHDKEYKGEYSREYGRDLINIGVVYWSWDQFDKSIEFYKRAEEVYRICRHTKDEHWVALYINYSAAYLGLNNLDKAYYYAQEAEYKHGDVAQISNLMGQCLIKSDTLKAIDLHKRALELYKSRYPDEINQFIAHTFQYIGECYIELENWQEAKNNLLDALKIYEMLGLHDFKRASNVNKINKLLERIQKNG